MGKYQFINRNCVSAMQPFSSWEHIVVIWKNPYLLWFWGLFLFVWWVFGVGGVFYLLIILYVIHGAELLLK